MALLNDPVLHERSRGIDTLRAVCVLWVIFAHVIPWAAYYEGNGAVPSALLTLGHWFATIFQPAGETHPAVLAFTVLSGYCVHRAGLRADTPCVAKFAIRRVLRIFPVFLAAIAAGAITFVVSTALQTGTPTLIGGTTSISIGCMTAKVTGISAFVPRLSICAFEGNAPLNEVQAQIWLYVAYPVLLLLVARRLGEITLWAIVAVVWLVGAATISVDPGLSSWWQTSSVFGFLLYWWIGAKALDPRFVALLRRGLWFSLIVWCALTALLFWLPLPPIAEFRKLVSACLCALAVSTIDRSANSVGALARLGTAGYSLYAFHTPIAHVVLVALRLPWWSAIATAIIFGIAAFCAFERPLTRYGRRLAQAIPARQLVPPIRPAEPEVF